MKKTVKLIAALCLMAALVLSLAACGDSLEGTWKCTNFKDAMLDYAASQGMDRAQVEEQLKASGIDDMIFNITLKKDNTCTMEVRLPGEEYESMTYNWTSDDKTVTISPDNGGTPLVFTRDGSKLTVDKQGMKLVFEKD